MCGSGKSATSTQSQSGSVMGSPMAQAVAGTAWGKALNASNLPFQTYGGEFVAPVNPQQNLGISGINDTSGTYAPYAAAAGQTIGQGLGAGMTGTAANASLDPNSIARWMSPYIQQVVGATERQQQQQNQIQQSQLESSAINSGAFGGDRSGVAAANLAYQQNLANQPVIANLYNQGFSQALGEANTQQQLGLSAANQLFNMGLTGAQGLSSLGTQQQQNQLGVANAQIGAGTLQQQTQQALDAALYNQFLQQQAYPFQTSQFLTNAATGLMPAWGTTSTQTGTATQPMSFFRRGGRTNVTDMAMGDDGEFRPGKDSGGGLSAYKAELSDKTMDTARTRQNRWRQYHMGVPMEGWDNSAPEFFHTLGPDPNDVELPPHVSPLIYITPRSGFAGGGGLSTDLGEILAAHAAMYGAPGATSTASPMASIGLSGGHSAALPTVHFTGFPSARSDSGLRSGLSTANTAVDFGKNLAGVYSAGKEAAVGAPARGKPGDKDYKPASGGWWGYGGTWGASAPPAGTTMSSSSPTAPTLSMTPSGQLVPTLPDGTPISDSPSGIDQKISDWSQYAHGGRAHRAVGGMSAAIPYESDIGTPYIPAGLSDPDREVAWPTNQLSGMSGSKGSMSSGLGQGMSDINNLVKLGTTIASLAAFRKGGRIHKDTGGALTPVSDLIDPDKVAAIETGGGSDENPNFPSSKGGPKGPHQFVQKTWNQFVSENPQYFEGKTPAEIDAARRDPAMSKLATYWYAGRNKPTLEQAGLPVTPDNLYLAHAQGGAGATALLSNPDKSAVEALTPAYGGDQYAARRAVLDNLDPKTKAKVVDKDGNINMTAAQFAQTFKDRYNGAKGAAPQMQAASLAANVPAPMPTGTAGPQQSWWDRESGGLSGTERAVISLLSGLGGMASSPSRFLGSAVLQGLGAGAGTYGALAQKGKALDIQQQQANTAVGRLGIEGVRSTLELQNKLLTMAQAAARNGQQVPQWITDQLRSIQFMLNGNVPYQTGLPGTAVSPTTSPGGQGLSAPPPLAVPPTQNAPLPAPVSVKPLPAPQQGALPATPPVTAQAPPHEPGTPPTPNRMLAGMPKMDFSQLPNEMNPDWLMERSREQGQLGNGEAADKFRSEAQRLYDKYTQEGQAMVGGNVVPIPGWDNVQAWKLNVPLNQKYITEQADQALLRARARQQLNTITKVMEDYQTGALSDFKAHAQALAKSLGIPVPNTAGMNAAAYQEFLKSAIRNAFADVKDMGGKPLVTEIENSMQATANPGLQPEANRKIMAMLYANLDQADKYGREVGAAMSGNKGLDRQPFTTEWLNKPENDLTKMADERERGLAVRGATPDNIADFKDGQTYIIEPGQFGQTGITKPTKYRFRRDADGKPHLDLVK